jgi:hypothetical protein
MKEKKQGKIQVAVVKRGLVRFTPFFQTNIAILVKS